MQLIFFGILTGSILAVASVGFAMIRQIEGFLNIAHGQFLLLGALFGLYFTEAFGLPVLFGGLLGAVFVGMLGVAIGWLVFSPLRGKSLLAQFFTSIGVAFVLYGLINATWTGAGIKTFPVDFGKLIDLGLIRVTPGELFVLAVAWISILGLHIFLAHTTLGTSIRAVASNPSLARVRGIRVDQVHAIVWFLAAFLAAVAGILIGVLGSVHSELGWHYILTILAVAVMGGVRNLYGVMAAGLILGLVVDMSQLVIPSKYGMVVAFGVIILTLLLRPEGLFSFQKRREAGA